MLKCEACGHELESAACPHCGGDSPADAEYCCRCGKSLSTTPEEVAAAADTAGGDYDPDERVLCGDESCIGIIDENGKCTECGRTLAESAAGD